MPEAVWWSDTPEKAAAVAMAVGNKFTMSKASSDKPLAAIFDIDETLLKNSENYGVRKKDMYAVQPCGKILFNWCKKNGVRVILVTARAKSKKARDFALEQLTKLGYDLSNNGPYEGVYMTSVEFEDREDAGGAFKAKAREKIMKDYTVILNCGDRMTDVMLEKYEDEFCASMRSQLPKGTDLQKMYIGLIPNDGIMHSVKFPEFD